MIVIKWDASTRRAGVMLCDRLAASANQLRMTVDGVVSDEAAARPLIHWLAALPMGPNPQSRHPTM